MVLKSIELFGFKSFPERTRIEFTKGVCAILGPNGCGKSNIVDAVKWVLGEQSTKSLRADSMEDVIFNGTETRKPLNWAEVILTLGNEDGLLDLQFSEVTVGRRIYRNGESEYTINRTPVKLKDIRDLFMDTGVGKSAYSIMEQGKIDQVLSHKPEERRYLFEEAAGITRYKTRSLEAEKKLEKTQENLRQVEGILGEVKRSYDSLKAQAEKTAVYRALRQEIYRLEKTLALSRLREFQRQERSVLEELGRREEERQQIKAELDRINAQMGQGLEGVERWEEELKALQRRLHELELHRSRVQAQQAMLGERERFHGQQIEKARTEAEKTQAAIDDCAARLEQAQRDWEKTRSDLEADRQNLDLLAQRALALQETIERHRSEESRLVQAEEELARQLRQATERLAQLTESLVQSIDREIASDSQLWSALEEWMRDIHDEIGRLDLLLRSRRTLWEDYERGGGDIQVLRAGWLEASERIEAVKNKYERLHRTVPLLLGQLLSPQGSLWQKRQQDQTIKDLHQRAAELARQKQELAEHRRSSEEQLAALRNTLEDLKVNLARQESLLQSRRADLERLERERAGLHVGLEEAKLREREEQVALEAVRAEKTRLLGELAELDNQEEALRQRQEGLRGQIQSGSHLLSELERTQRDLFHRLEGLQATIEKLSRELGEHQAEIRSLVENFRDRHGTDLLHESPTAVEDIPEDQARQRLADCKERLRALGHVNLMAPEEFKEVAERYEFLTRQVQDLQKAREDLRAVVSEIHKEATRLFLETFRLIQKNFNEVFRRLFGGGRAELRLTDETNVLESGIELFCQPPGKKLESISLLSGGERSLTAVALLFAIYMVRPSPFCLLDEIDAALDESNVGRFIALLQEFSSTSQFIVITHNKRTVTGASTLIGVTMEESGVSKVISLKLAEPVGSGS